MHRLKLSRLLPTAQVVITAILTFWADRVYWMALGDGTQAPGRFVRVHLAVIDLRQIWRGVNAPALPFSVAGYDGARPKILGFGAAELMYFVAVGLLWWAVGRWFDKRRSTKASEKSRARAGVIAVLGVAWGLILVGVTVVLTRDALKLLPDVSMLRNFLFLLRNRPETLLTYFLFLLWSVVLVNLNVAKLAHAVMTEKPARL